jgi:hypothetical protein
MPEHRLRLRVYALRAPYSWAWVYEVRDPARPAGHQIVVLGTRARWREALRDGHETLRMEETQRSAA